jgi:hypothetical protein
MEKRNHEASTQKITGFVVPRVLSWRDQVASVSTDCGFEISAMISSLANVLKPCGVCDRGEEKEVGRGGTIKKSEPQKD